MRRLLSLLALVALPASAITFDPPQPDSHTWITAKIFVNACVPSRPEVTRNGTTITIKTGELPGFACIPEYVPPPVNADIGPLPGGVYDVNVIGGATPEHATLTVRGVDPFRVVPPGAAATGGIPVRLRDANVSGISAPLVRFGDTVVTGMLGGGGDILVTAPPHAPGLVDVSLIYPDSTATAVAAFKYTESETPPDPFIFERVLFPVSFDGTGAFGSQWTTDNAVYLVGRTTVLSQSCGCTVVFSGRVTVVNNNAPSGRLLFVGRDTYDVLSASSRIRDTTRQAQTAGTSVPVVFERDFVDTPLVFANVPPPTNARVTLRVWSLAPAQIAVSHADTSVTIATAGSGLAFGSADITALVGNGGEVLLDVAPPSAKLWAMISVTNNDTQAVTVVAPSIRRTPMERP